MWNEVIVAYFEHNSVICPYNLRETTKISPTKILNSHLQSTSQKSSLLYVTRVSVTSCNYYQHYNTRILVVILNSNTSHTHGSRDTEEHVVLGYKSVYFGQPDVSAKNIAFIFTVEKNICALICLFLVWLTFRSIK
jgi:hypothetical protein